MKNLIEIINEISEKAKGQLKPDLKKYGKNFRAISESAILETLNPLFKEYHIAYEFTIQEQHLNIEKIRAGKDAAGNLIEKLVFVADAKVILRLFLENHDLALAGGHYIGDTITFEGWGSGVDSGDKATGKAITAATKYALLKGFRLQYSDDPDAEASEDIESIIEGNLESAGNMIADVINNGLDEIHKQEKKAKKEEPLATEKMLNFVMGLAADLKMSDSDFNKEFGFFPYDKEVDMRKVRAAIDKLKARKEELPF